MFVPFDARGNPGGKAITVLSGFLTDDGGTVYGRPTWLAWDATGALLVTDDTAGIIWRVLAPGAALSVAPREVIEESMPPQRELDAGLDRQFKMRVRKDVVIEE